jgi:hypothetical protein
VLTLLRELEENARVPLSDDAYDAGSDRSSQGRVASPTELSDVQTDASFSVSVMRVGGRRESILVWDEEEDDFNVDEESERLPRERWDERLVLGSGWLYKQDLKIEDLAKQRGVIARYLDTVDEVLFGGSKNGVRGWVYEQERAARKEKPERSKGRRSSAPPPNPDSASPSTESGLAARRLGAGKMMVAMRDLVLTEEPEELQTLVEEEDGDGDDDDDDDDEEDEASSMDDEDLPRWAKRSAFPDDPLIRSHALLVALLPTSLLPHLPGPQDRAEFLNAVSSGQLLCVAYNVGVRQSRKPWGYINVDSIHDIIALEAAVKQSEADGAQEEKARKGWTFRRTDNLRLWGAAMKIRYMLPIISPASPDVPMLKPNPTGDTLPPSPSSSKFSEPPIFFDAREVARRDDGWEDMLERILFRWTVAVVEERRNHSR